MKLALIVAAVLAIPSLALAEKSYNDAAKSVTHDCSKEPEVAVNASSGTYTFTGACTKIMLNGASLKVTIESAAHVAVNGASNEIAIIAVDKLAVTGASNTITYKKGVKGDKVKTADLGSGNKISKVK